MNQTIQDLVEALREQLKTSGEMLAVLEQQQDCVVRRATEQILRSVSEVQRQVAVLQQHRDRCEQCRKALAANLQLSDKTEYGQLIAQAPEEYRPLLKALLDENRELLLRIQRRTRQNHLLLSRSLQLMQQLLATLFPACQTAVYSGKGELSLTPVARQPLYDAIG